MTNKQAEHPGASSADARQKYISKIFNDDWMRENGFLDEQPGLGTVRDLLGEQTEHRSSRASPTPRCAT